MSNSQPTPSVHKTGTVTTVGLGLSALLLTGAALMGASPAFAAESNVGLGTVKPFAVLAGSAVTNTGPSVVSGDLGVSPGTSVTGFPPGLVINGTQHVTDAVAAQAQNDLTTAYNDAAGRSTTVDVTGQDLGGKVLTSGVYSHASGLPLTGVLTLDAQNDPAAVWIFNAGSSLTTAPNSRVELVNGADPCNVYWQVGSSATLDTNTQFVGTVMALTSATLNTGATVQGRILARNGAVTLDTNVITAPTCTTVVTPPPVPPTTAPPTTAPPTTKPTTKPPTTKPTTKPPTTKPTTKPPTTKPPTKPPTTTPTTRPPTTPPTTTPPVTPTSTPKVPVGHPKTGNGGSAQVADTHNQGPLLFLLAGLAAAGTVVLGATSIRTHSRR